MYFKMYTTIWFTKESDKLKSTQNDANHKKKKKKNASHLLYSILAMLKTVLTNQHPFYKMHYTMW